MIMNYCVFVIKKIQTLLVVQHKYNFKKDKLIKEGFNPDKSEHDIMFENNNYRIYNAGDYKFKFIM